MVDSKNSSIQQQANKQMNILRFIRTLYGLIAVKKFTHQFKSKIKYFKIVGDNKNSSLQ